MPYAYDPLEEEKKKQESGGDPGAAPAMTGGGSSFGGAPSGQVAMGAGSQPQQDKGAQRQGSGFVNLSKYMDANKGSNFGGQVTSRVQGEVGAAKQGLAQNSQAFTQASNQGATKWGDVGGQAKSIIDTAGDNTSKDDVSKLQGYASAKYQGPENFGSTAFGAQSQGQVGKAAQSAKALQSEGGRFSLLDNYFGRPKYSTGEKTLDNFLVQSTPGVASRSQALGTQANQVSGDFSKTAQALNNLAASNRQSTADTAKNTGEYLNTARTGFENDLNKRYQDFTSQNQAYNDARMGDLSDDQLDTDTLGLLGLQEGSNVYDLNLSNYIKQAENPTLGQYASDPEYSKYLALQQLAGEDPSLLRSEDRAQAGTGANKGRVGMDTEALRRDIEDRSSKVGQVTSQISQNDSQVAGLNSTMDQLKAASATGADVGPLMKQVQDELNEIASQNASLNSQIAQYNPSRRVSSQMNQGMRGMPVGSSR